MAVRKAFKKWKSAHESFEKKANTQRIAKAKKVYKTAKRAVRKISKLKGWY